MKQTIAAAIIAFNLANETSAVRLNDIRNLSANLSINPYTGPGTDSYNRFRELTEDHEMRNLRDIDDNGSIGPAETNAMQEAVIRENIGLEDNAVQNYIRSIVFDDFDYNGEEGHADCVSYEEWLDVSEMAHSARTQTWWPSLDTDGDDCLSEAEFDIYLDVVLHDDMITETFDRIYGGSCDYWLEQAAQGVDVGDRLDNCNSQSFVENTLEDMDEEIYAAGY